MKYERWISKSVRDTIRNNELSDIICKMPEGNVYRFGKYVIKERRGTKGRSRQGPKKSVRREYKVGVLANQVSSEHLVKTYGYVESGNGSRLVTGFVDGITLSKFLKRYDLDRCLPVIRHLMIILFYLQRKCGFCHYGLHSSNVMIVRLSKPQTYEYRIFDKTYSVTTIYCPVIIDLGRSYIHGIEDMYYEGEIIGSLVTPGIFDAQIDITFILWSLRSRLLEVCPKSYQLLVKNGLLNERYSLNHRRLENIPRSLKQNDSLWACQKGVSRSHDTVLREYKKQVDKCKRIIPGGLINTYAKELAGCMVKFKVEDIDNRRYCDQFVFRTLVGELDR